MYIHYIVYMCVCITYISKIHIFISSAFTFNINGSTANSHLKETLDFLSSVRAGSFLEDLFNPQCKYFHTGMKLFYGVCVCTLAHGPLTLYGFLFEASLVAWETCGAKQN